MTEYPLKTILERSKKTGYFANHYDILGIPRFGDYDPTRKQERFTINRRETLDKNDQDQLARLILDADKYLKNPALKAQYDIKLRQYLDKEENPVGLSMSYGMPRLDVEGFGLEGKRLIFDEMRPNTRITRELRVMNVANTGILNATVSVSRQAKWLSLSTNRVTQNELHKPIIVTINTGEEFFENTSSRTGEIEFTYQTDKGTKKYVLSVMVTLEGLLKKTKRILKFSNIAFTGIYAILILALLSFGGFAENSFITKLIVFASIGFLGYTLYNINKATDFRDFLELNEGTTRIVAGISLFILLVSNFQAFLLFMIPIVVAVALRYMAKKSLMPEFIRYVPLVGLGLFTMTLLSSQPFRTSLFSGGIALNTPPPVEAQVQQAPKKQMVFLKTDVNLRAQPSPQGTINGQGLAGRKYEVIELRPQSNWQKVNIDGKVGYLYITEQTGQIIME